MPTVVIVDDEQDMRLLLGLALRRRGFDVVGEAVDGIEGLEVVNRLPPPEPDVVVLDNRMPRRSGVELAALLRAERPQLPVVLFSAFLDEATIEQAEAAGIAMCVAKDRMDELPGLLEELLDQDAA